jgi:hypothetical protein
VVAGSVAAVLLASLTSAAQASPVSTRTSTMFVVHDPAIDEDSALAQAGDFLVTTNDAGDAARVFTINHNGRTVGVTHWAKSQTDCEAVAPIDATHVWVGDIGDNYRVRSSIVISKVRVGRGNRTVRPPQYHLVYPDGAHNAETLIRDPATGRLYIATKDPAGGTLYEVPENLSSTEPNLLTPIAPVLPTATDGAFFASGNYVAIRGYTSGELYAWPTMTPVGSFRLPAQRQGEGLATTTGGSVLLSSEFVRQPVLRYRLPARLRRILKTAPAA